MIPILICKPFVKAAITLLYFVYKMCYILGNLHLPPSSHAPVILKKEKQIVKHFEKNLEQTYTSFQHSCKISE